ncbi:MAG: hypothetical protein D3916_16825 [Candidatus Electrothrix sp. MAN1_4]|nr:hypothetical protein [Candidatus Electrothrix sp. MAN1_4]
MSCPINFHCLLSRPRGAEWQLYEIRLSDLVALPQREGMEVYMKTVPDDSLESFVVQLSYFIISPWRDGMEV